MDEVRAAQRPVQRARGREHLVGAAGIHRDPQHVDALVDQAARAVVVGRRHQVDQRDLGVAGDRVQVADHEGTA